ncbi:MAG: hypothetical protein IAC51_05195 [bacterium]|uniref:Uncharacterized protein n=1 Tax=Candidatus Aphodosoma intestinipullorum TaxID=2840674 RepID=A0A940DJW4_9BACT|nr:hypothetical protein [Candidatus Aphodosoma intestinipullorum]
MKRTFSKSVLFVAALAGVTALTSCEKQENVGINGLSGETTDVTIGVTVKSGAPTKATADEMNMGATIKDIKNIYVVPRAGTQYASPISIPDITGAGVTDKSKATNKTTAEVDKNTDAFLVYAGVEHTMNKTFTEAGMTFSLEAETLTDAWGTTAAKTVYKPYSLFYFGEATNVNGGNKFQIGTGTDWETASWADVADNGTVAENTLIKVPGVKYAVGALVVGILDGVGDFDLSENNDGSLKWADVKNQVTVEGLVIDGQPSQLDFEFNRAASAQDQSVYVAAAANAFQTGALAFADEGKVAGANFYSVVAEDGGEGNDVTLQFRFKNNTGASFYVGPKDDRRLVEDGKYFYTNAIIRYEADEQQSDLTTIFKKATTTLVNASLKDLTKATTEPEDPTEATIGVEIDATWNSGHIYSVDM